MEDRETPGILAPPPLIVGGLLVLGLLIDRAAGTPRRPAAGTIAVVAGLGLGASAIASIRRAGTAVNPYAPTTALVSSGPFAVSRNPIYVGMLGIAAGVALRAGSLTALALLPAALVLLERGVIEREERYLERRFGDAYRAYMDRVPRWL